MTGELEDNQAFARALFGGAPPDPDAPPDLDGGPPADHGPDDPEHDHNQLIAQLLRGQEPE